MFSIGCMKFIHFSYNQMKSAKQGVNGQDVLTVLRGALVLATDCIFEHFHIRLKLVQERTGPGLTRLCGLAIMHPVHTGLT